MALADLQTIVVLVLENRSFDHLLGYLSLQSGHPAVEGLKSDPAWQAEVANSANGALYGPHPLAATLEGIDDPPHDHATIGVQIDTPPAAGASRQMGGFVASYLTRQPAPTDASAVMGYYTAQAVPMCDFFARNFVICDHWFAAVPSGTQANRLMLMGGDTGIVDNASVFLPDQELVYDWLEARDVPWCAYQSGDFLPFFSLMSRWLPRIAESLAVSALALATPFRRYSSFRQDWNGNAPMPAVIFIEPEYTDGPHVSANDDHAPSGVGPGQTFMAQLYGDLLSNPARWARTALIVTYDEHGGFFDHVPPLPIPYANGAVQFDTTGVRVPGFVISPLVAGAQTFSGALDHTSILQLLADRFDAGQDYSASVGARLGKLDRLARLFEGPARVSDPPAAPQTSAPAPAGPFSARLAGAPIKDGLDPDAPPSANALAFRSAALRLAAEHPDALASPGWQDLSRYVNQLPNGPSGSTTP